MEIENHADAGCLCPRADFPEILESTFREVLGGSVDGALHNPVA